MGKLEKGFAVGAIAFAALVGGLLYALYPNDFNGYTEPTSAGTDYSTASQSDTGASAGSSSSPQPSNNGGY